MLNLNNQKDSLFFNKIDLEKIGISGLSQGGAVTFNAITRHGDSRKAFKCVLNHLQRLNPVWTI